MSKRCSTSSPGGADARRGPARILARHPAAVLCSAFIAGILFWGGFNLTMELTNVESFCISCHEMEDNVYMEYVRTVHYRNPSGIKATCPDCHVPRDWNHMLVRKMRATNELLHKVIGTIDTREKFLARRFHLAKIVWKSMQRSDSRECRNCHRSESMDLRGQAPDASTIHEEGRRKGATCIDCHKGIAHELPEEFLEAEHERFEREKVPCRDCHVGMARAPDSDWSSEK